MSGKWATTPFGGVTWTGIVHVDAPRDATFPGFHVADVREVFPEGTVEVSLHLEAEHPAVLDALGDGVIASPDEGEWIDRVPAEWVWIENATECLAPHLEAFWHCVAVKKREAEERRLAEAREAERRENVAKYLAGPRMDLADLDESNAERKRSR